MVNLSCCVFVSQLIRYARVCSKYEDCLLLKLQTTFRKFYGRHTYLVHKFDTSVSHMLNVLFTNPRYLG